MSTEEKIKLYEELHPEGKKFPPTKKPDEKPKDMQWLDDKIAEFQKLKEEKENQINNQSDDQSPVKITTVEPQKVYTVDQIKGLPEEKFKEIEQLVNDGEARVVNSLDEVQG